MRNEFARPIGTLILTLVLAGPVAGEGIDLACEIKAEMLINDDGSFRPVPTDPDGSSFSVNRVTGTIVGGPLATTGLIRQFVLDLGSAQSFFKLYTLEPTPNGTRYVRYLSVDVGHESGKKPFVAIDGASVMSGVCRSR